MSNLVIDVPPELERQLQREAERRGVTVSEYARNVLEAAIPAGGMPEGPADLDELARQQGVQPIADSRSLLGDFWPEDETCDDFIAAVREWRREGTRG